jgi:NADH-quinone oxidoreductase subunit J
MSWLGYAYFYICAAVAVVGALVTITARNPIRGAMGLLTMILSVAGLFLALHAQFLAAIQVIVYAGAIVVLFLFVIMLLGPSATSPRDQKDFLTRALGASLFGLVLSLGLVLVARGSHPTVMGEVATDFGGVDAFGRALFADALVPFELSSALLIVAVVGALAVARGRQGEHTLAAPETKPSLASSAPDPVASRGDDTAAETP